MHALPASLMTLLLMLLAPAGGWLGVMLAPDREEAVVAGEPMPDSPAAKAGLQDGDVLLAVGEQKTPTREEFVAAIQAAKAGTKVTLRVLRGDETLAVDVVLGERPAQNAPSGTSVKPKAKASAEAPRRGYLGIAVREADDQLVVERVLPGAPAEAAGVRAGDRLARVGGSEVDEQADLDAAMQKVRPGDKLEVELRTGDEPRTVTIVVGELPQREATVQAVPVRPVPQSARPARPVRPARPARADADLEKQVAELRAELAEIRRLLEELRNAKE